MESMEGLNGKNVLVTGGTGFVGSHLAEALTKRGATVVVAYRALDPRSYFCTRKLDQKVTLAAADMKDGKRVNDLMSRYEIDYIFHLAAQSTVPVALEHPEETLETNIMGTVHVLEAARRTGRVKGIIVASSDKAYGKSKRVYTENDPLRGDHPYEVSKSAADLVAVSYAKTYKLPVTVTRFGNIYGEGDLHFNRIIPGAMQTIITGDPLILRSDGTHVRDWVYVKDVVEGYLFLLEHMDVAAGEAFNLSSGQSMTVIQLLKTLERIVRKDILYTIANTQQNEIPYQHLDYKKITKLGWSPRYTLEDTIPQVLSWYRKHYA